MQAEDEGAGQQERLRSAWARAIALLDEDLRTARRRAGARAAPTPSTSASSRAGRSSAACPPRTSARRRCAATSPTCQNARPAAGGDGVPAPRRAPPRASSPPLRALFASQREHGRISQNPADLVSTPRRGSHLPRVLSAREAGRLLDAIPVRGPLELRDRAMFELAYSCGLRAEELVSLEHRRRRPRRRAAAGRGQGAKDALRARRRAGDGRREGLPGARARKLADQAAPAPAQHQRAPARTAGRTRCSSARPAGRWAPATCGGGCDVDRAGRRRRGRLAARAAPQLRHPPARRRRGPAQHPGAARARERVEHPDLHSGRVRQA